MKEDYQKSSNNVTSFLFSNPVSFYEHYHEKQTGLELFTCPFSGFPWSPGAGSCFSWLWS